MSFSKCTLHGVYSLACSRQPEVLWAQRSEKIYLTISLPDAKDVELKTEPKGLVTFSAVAHGEPFSFTLELFDSILPEVGTCWLLFWISIWAPCQQTSCEPVLVKDIINFSCELLMANHKSA